MINETETYEYDIYQFYKVSASNSKIFTFLTRIRELHLLDSL